MFEFLIYSAHDNTQDKIEIQEVREYVKNQFNPQQWQCIDELWDRESSWRTHRKPWRARNSASGAYGIPQSLPASKMATEGIDFLNNPYTQIRWGLKYIKDRYDTPCNALRHHDKKNWY